eukprot:TRINITY_DN2798_c0_g1_i2.p1 TRINITY_DN2798_c0_g1~~TRINITY_DN2798_c0_g1_i2.p1  ORF type:complete len:290 (+),score=93.75 TRINITY_DN2798_c0_g1_i2:43-912(+)
MASILDSLVGNYTDSEGEEEMGRDVEKEKEEDRDSREHSETMAPLADRLKEGVGVSTPGSGTSGKSATPTKKTTKLVEYQDPDAGMSDEDRESVPMELESEEDENGDMSSTKEGDDLEKSHLMEELWAEGVQLPPEPQGPCSLDLQDKIETMWKNKVEKNINYNNSIQSSKKFRNPSIYEKFLSYLDIDELGTNFPPDLYDGHLFGKESYYEELEKQQKIEMDKLGKAADAKKKLGDANVKEALNAIQQRKSKWDQAATGRPAGAILPGALAAPTLSKTIPAFGALKKK